MVHSGGLVGVLMAPSSPMKDSKQTKNTCVCFPCRLKTTFTLGLQVI